MKTFWAFIVRRIREYIFLVTTLPFATFFIVLVAIGFNNDFLPLAALLFLAMLSIMQWIAGVEIRRTNKILKTNYPLVQKWFSHPFFSWEGVKERITSLRSWMAILYVICAFGVSIGGFILLTIGATSFFAVLLALSLISVGSFTRTFELLTSQNGDQSTELTRIYFNFFGDTQEFRLRISGLQNLNIKYDPVISGTIDSAIAITVCIVLSLLAFWLALAVSRVIPPLVEGLLSGIFLPQFQSSVQKLTTRGNVNEQQVQEAMGKKSLQPQISVLSNREREILALMAQGKSNAGIAKSLSITEGSVEKHVSNILSKLDIKQGEEIHRRVLAVLTYLGINHRKGSSDKV